MARARTRKSATPETESPEWCTVDDFKISLESLESGPLPDGSQADDIKRLQHLVRFLARERRLLKERLDEELKHRYSPRSEKRGKKKPAGEAPGDEKAKDPAASEADSSTAPPEASDEETDPAGPAEAGAKQPGHGRRPIPPNLPRDERLILLEPEECQDCGGPVHRLERLESYRYDYVPGYIRVRVLARWRYACDDSSCVAPFSIADLPPEPIPKGRATAGFLAHLLVIKFADHCPLYRFRKILLRQKVDLALSTLVDYGRKSTELLKPLWEVFKQQVLLSSIIRTDDTPVQMRLPRKKGTLKGHLWAYKGDEEHPYVVFEFTSHWRGEAPQEFLEGFVGYIQADAYKGYDALFKDGKRTEVGCMAHARRKWVKAEGSSPRVVGEALDMIGNLYEIEERCREWTPEERKRLRKEESTPVLESFRLWMEDQGTRVLPKSPVGEAIGYAQNQWVALTRFLEDGRLKIDNNDVELELRNVALGRKNWLAAGSEVGGETAAIGYTMIASAAACGVEPVEWLTDVLEKIVTWPKDRLIELLPDRWKAARVASSTATIRPVATQDVRASQDAPPSEPPSTDTDRPAAPSGSESTARPETVAAQPPTDAKASLDAALDRSVAAGAPSLRSADGNPDETPVTPAKHGSSRPARAPS